LSQGDITKRDAVIWGFSPDESVHFIEDNIKNNLLRDAILSFFSPPSEKEVASNDYCKACKQLKKDKVDCSKCSKTFEVIEVGKKR